MTGPDELESDDDAGDVLAGNPVVGAAESDVVGTELSVLEAVEVSGVLVAIVDEGEEEADSEARSFLVLD